MNRGAWRATVHRSQRALCDLAHTPIYQRETESGGALVTLPGSHSSKVIANVSDGKTQFSLLLIYFMYSSCICCIC